MATIVFEILDSDYKTVKVLDKEHVLLRYFIRDYRVPRQLGEITGKLKQVLNGEKTFDEIRQHPQMLWGFGEGSGTFECDKNTAYFESRNPVREPSMEMPLGELIDILERWKAFLEQD